MDMARHSTATCHRVRAWAALAPDGELSQLERKLLDAHLSRCAACAAFAVEVAGVTAELRAAAAEPLARPVAIPVWRRHRSYAGVRAVGAAAAIAAMTIGIASRGPLATNETASFQLPRVTDYSLDVQAEAAQLNAVRRNGALARPSVGSTQRQPV
jgi:predicted anti-sigma-YlaC factor YlaD